VRLLILAARRAPSRSPGAWRLTARRKVRNTYGPTEDTVLSTPARVGGQVPAGHDRRAADRLADGSVRRRPPAAPRGRDGRASHRRRPGLRHGAWRMAVRRSNRSINAAPICSIRS
jgi:hypothetical protein